jgi:hypothetical protein
MACCEGRLARLEKRVCWIRTGLLIALGVLLVLIGIGIGKGGAREEMRERAVGMMHRRAMMRGPGPMGGPGPMMGGRPMPGMRGDMGPGPRPDRGPGEHEDGPDDDRPGRRDRK